MSYRPFLASWLGFAVAELVICPLHGLSKLLLWSLASLCPILAQSCHATHDLLVSWAYAVITWHGQPPVPSLAYFRAQAEAAQIVHGWGTTLAIGLLLAPVVRAWAKRRWPV